MKRENPLQDLSDNINELGKSCIGCGCLIMLTPVLIGIIIIPFLVAIGAMKH